ncbi:DUF445 domain-containing protein [Halothermothrix orenii]|uniref:Uncharacterized protein conserved in bacteria n=1 Tax=Halothermothrix orenii (strain H 168 / OCM 544 / DSM 9562) TaxID=373903 RepID=B8D286_HALOH|nr:DUF445 family protein [Halothermothrix orenii]ACL69313.1 uncharacterized protein conserved in bacteria [Halothermothrix orenii H 168]
MISGFIILPVVGALIGWITNYLAVKMLFRPYNPVKIPFIPVTIQGVLPRRKMELAESVARAIEEELLPKEYLLSRVNELQLEEDVLDILRRLINEKVDDKLPGFIPDSFKQVMKNYISEFIEEEMKENLDRLVNDFHDTVVNKTNFGRLVQEKIESFPLTRLEDIVLKISSRELKHIELFGGVLGFIVGLGQALLLLFFNF